ncbi:hypothetical protein ACMD2_08810 [Ananas comosus]|uniref:Uncharacterized protein n=1 Tax=Ananas comosus TaxID=4615 RepID=A0A199UIE4_ANACO|nr:hypothetical protein ACMD2_08810 [Ananas comosus]
MHSVFTNALSSPIGSSLQPRHLTQGGGYYSNTGSPPTANGDRNSVSETSHSRESNSTNSNET